MESNPSESDSSKSGRLGEKRTLQDVQCEEFEDSKHIISKKPKTEPEKEQSSCALKAGDGSSVPTKPTDVVTDIKPRIVSFTSGKSKAAASKKKVKSTLKEETSGEGSKNGTQPKDKPKGNMRRNIRDILKENELEAETRAAQKRELERIQRLQQQQQQIEANFSNEFDIPGQDNSAAELVDNLHALAKELEGSNLSPETPIQVTDETQNILPFSPAESSSTVKPLTAAKKVVDDYDVIYLSSDEEDLVPNSKPAVLIQHKHIVCEDEDDDDVVILSDDDDKKEAGDDDDGDVNNFGLHTRDEFNRPDGQGRVLVNVGHPSNEADIFLAPQLARAAKPHQIGGIRFLYDNVVENLEQFSTSPGFGCILAHSMGLGKTFQVCAFSDVFLRHTIAKTVLIIVPINTIQNWVAEFNSWLPAEQNPNCMNADPPIQPRSFILHVLNDATKDLNSRFKVINDWINQGGVLLMGYEMYRLFYTQRESREKKRVSKKKKAGMVDLEEEEKEKGMIEQIFQALVNPGPELIICDEGHRIKNMKASISVALKEIRTRRRVVLTGYPLQNNLLEYWCMVDFVRPNFLGTRPEFSNMFERPIQNGQCVDSSPADVKLMKERVYVLHSLVKGFVQRRSHTVLRASLPHKEEHVLLLRLTPLQRALYRHHMSQLVQNKSVCNPLRAFAICLKIWNHPDVLYNFFKKGQEDLDLDLDEEMSESRKKKKTTAGAKVQPVSSASVKNEYDSGDLEESSNTTASSSQTPNPASKEPKKDDLSTVEWAYDLMKDYVPGNIDSAAKTRIFFTILEESIKLGDRMLVFSQSLFTLDMLEEFLQQRVIPGKSDERWAKNRSYFRLDGSTSGMEREKLVNDFNANADVLLFLISTRAGSLGINLIGANRVVVFDASWNPCHDAQAVCRVYRYGQQKQCFIYRLVTDNSLEKKIYNRQIGKQGTSNRVVDELNPEARLTLRDVTTLVCDNEEDPPLFDFGIHHNQKDLKDLVLQAVLKKWGTSFTKDPFQHDALLAESKESKLSKAEKRMAQRLYEKAKLDGTMQYRRQNYSTYYPKTSIPIPNLGFTGSYGNSFGQNNYHPPYPQFRPPPNLSLNVPPSNGLDLLTEALNQGKLVCKEMVLNKDVTISRSQLGGSSSDLVPVVLPAGTRVKLIKTPKGIYMQTPEGKIFRIHSSSHAPHGTPSTMAAVLGIGHKPHGSVTSEETAPQRNNDDQISSQIDPAMLRRIIDAQTSGKLSPDKNAFLSQMLQRTLNGSKGLDESFLSAISGPGGRNLSLCDDSNFSHFAKQLAALAQRSTSGRTGLKSTSSNGASSADVGNNGLIDSSSKRSSSLLDPKARALPSASLPKKASATPNLSKARNFVPLRPTVSGEPIVTASERTATNIPGPFHTSTSSSSTCEMGRTESSSLPAMNNLSNMQTNVVDLTEANDFEGSSSGGSSNSGGSGLFDNLSLASQLEGFASGSTEGKVESAGSLRDLLKASNGTNNPSPSTSQWNNDSTVTEKNQSTPTWSNFAQWNVSPWNNSANNHSGWQWGQLAQQEQLSGVSQSMSQPPLFGNSSAQGALSTDVSSSSQSYASYSENYRQTDQWSNFSNLPSSSTASNSIAYPSHSHQFSNFYPPSHYDYNNGAFSSFTPSTQPEFTPVGNYPNFNGLASNSYTPGYPQPYPGSFSQ